VVLGSWVNEILSRVNGSDLKAKLKALKVVLEE
jgi:hypothetical protein